MFRHSTTYILVVALVALFSCTGGGGDDEKSSQELTEFNSDQHTESDVIKLNGELFSIPSPIQSAIFIKENGTGYREDLLLSPNELDAYQSGSQKAIALGLYGAELGYVSMYEENDMALSYMNAARKLADDIGISGAFRESLVQRFADNVGEPDSMVVLVSDIYGAADSYLKGNERNDVAALVLLGGWIESLYITCQEAESGSEAFKKRIAEQKSGFERLMKLISSHDENTVVTEMSEPLAQLTEAYSKVTSSYIYKNPEVDLGEQKTILKGEVLHQLDDATLKSIIAATTAIRNHITGAK